MSKYNRIPCHNCNGNVVPLLTSAMYLTLNCSPFYIEDENKFSSFLSIYGKNKHCHVCLNRVLYTTKLFIGTYNPIKAIETYKQLYSL